MVLTFEVPMGLPGIPSVSGVPGLLLPGHSHCALTQSWSLYNGHWENVPTYPLRYFFFQFKRHPLEKLFFLLLIKGFFLSRTEGTRSPEKAWGMDWNVGDTVQPGQSPGDTAMPRTGQDRFLQTCQN